MKKKKLYKRMGKIAPKNAVPLGLGKGEFTRNLIPDGWVVYYTNVYGFFSQDVFIEHIDDLEFSVASFYWTSPPKENDAFMEYAKDFVDEDVELLGYGCEEIRSGLVEGYEYAFMTEINGDFSEWTEPSGEVQFISRGFIFFRRPKKEPFKWNYGVLPTSDDTDHRRKISIYSIRNPQGWEPRCYEDYILRTGIPWAKSVDTDQFTPCTPAPSPFEQEEFTNQNK